MTQPIFTILLATFGVLSLAWVLWPRQTHRIRGPVAELESRISHLMRSGPQTFLIVKIARTKDFLQLSATPESAEIDFPLITDRQLELEPRIREATAELGLDCHETHGSDGSRFLDCDVSGSPADVARACRQLLQLVFRITEDATLVYETKANI